MSTAPVSADDKPFVIAVQKAVSHVQEELKRQTLATSVPQIEHPLVHKKVIQALRYRRLPEANFMSDADSLVFSALLNENHSHNPMHVSSCMKSRQAKKTQICRHTTPKDPCSTSTLVDSRKALRERQVRPPGDAKEPHLSATQVFIT